MSFEHVSPAGLLSAVFPSLTMGENYPILPRITTLTAIGIATAITGNILISLALNLQKLAHLRVEAEQLADYHKRPQNGRNGSSRHGAEPSLDERQEDEPEGNGAGSGVRTGSQTPTAASESQQLLTFPVREDNASADGYGTSPSVKSKKPARRPFWHLISPRKWRMRGPKGGHIEEADCLPVEVITEEEASDTPTKPSPNGTGDSDRQDFLDDAKENNETQYLKSKLWWLGFALMNLGEVGNFISYGFAPASIVAPLGTFALIANCFFAPLMLGEQFRKLDLFGVLVAIIGAVTVVLATNASDVRFNPDQLIHAICQRGFITYSVVYVIGALILSGLSQGQYGRKWVFVDVGLCALFGGFTALSTKALSTLLTLEWIEIFTEWITYPVILILAGTGVGQIRYLNRALMRFDSKVVIPSQFVLFNLSVIIGSAILYGDFKSASFHQMVTFLYGCGATFLGVFIIAFSSSKETNGESNDAATAQNNEPQSSGYNDPSSRLGSISRRRHAALIMPNGIEPTPIVRPRRSSLGMMGLSSAQHLLLVHTPPNNSSELVDLEHGPLLTPDSLGRRRGMNWFADRSTPSITTTQASSYA
jgi:hypothetical protein